MNIKEMKELITEMTKLSREIGLEKLSFPVLLNDSSNASYVGHIDISVTDLMGLESIQENVEYIIDEDAEQNKKESLAETYKRLKKGNK